MFTLAPAARADSPLIRPMPGTQFDDDISVGEPENDTDGEDIVCDDLPDARVQDVLALVKKVLRKGTKGKELDPRAFNDQERKAFDGNQCNTHIRTAAVAIIQPDTAKYVDQSRILRLNPRFVRTDNDSENSDLADLEAKSCMVVLGHVASE